MRDQLLAAVLLLKSSFACGHIGERGMTSLDRVGECNMGREEHIQIGGISGVPVTGPLIPSTAPVIIRILAPFFRVIYRISPDRIS